MKADRLSVTYRPGPLATKTTSIGTTSATAVRDLKTYCDQLQKEMERKETRLESQVKELNALRSSTTKIQRELRIALSSIEKLQCEKQRTSTELERVKSSNSELSSRNRQLHESQRLVDELQEREAEVSYLRGEIAGLNGTIGLRDNSIQALERELNVAHRAINAQNKYESGAAGMFYGDPNTLAFPSSSKLHASSSANFSAVAISGLSNMRESMRSLYYELGRRQADLHSVTLSLVDCNKDLDLSQQMLREKNAEAAALQSENDRLHTNIADLNRQTVAFSEQVASLTDKNEAAEGTHSELCVKIEHLSKQQAEDKIFYEDVINDKNIKIAQLTDFQEYLQSENQQLANRIDANQQSMQYFEKMRQANEEKMSAELESLKQEKEVLSQSAVRCSSLQAQVDQLHNSLHDAVSSKDTIAQKMKEAQFYADRTQQQLQDDIEDLRQNIESQNNELKVGREFEARIVTERNDALDALQQTMQATREISQKYQRERELRLAAEAAVEDLRRAKESVSTAVLDSLHREREKNKCLERALSDVPAQVLAAHHKDLFASSPAPPSFASTQQTQATSYPKTALPPHPLAGHRTTHSYPPAVPDPPAASNAIPAEETAAPAIFAHVHSSAPFSSGAPNHPSNSVSYPSKLIQVADEEERNERGAVQSALLSHSSSRSHGSSQRDARKGSGESIEQKPAEGQGRHHGEEQSAHQKLNEKESAESRYRPDRGSYSALAAPILAEHHEQEQDKGSVCGLEEGQVQGPRSIIEELRRLRNDLRKMEATSPGSFAASASLASPGPPSEG